MAEQNCPVGLAFGLNNWLFEGAMRSMPEGQETARAHPKTNEFRRIAAHLVISRHSIASLLELKPEPLPFGDLGSGMEAGFVEGKAFPTQAQLLAHWQKLGTLLMEKLPSVPAAVFERPSPMPLPGMEKATVRDFLAVIPGHEAYHLGQMGLIVKAVTGKSIMSPPKK